MRITKKVTLVLSILFLVSFTNKGSKKMHYNTAKKQRIFRAISKNKKAMQSLKKIKYAKVRNAIKENIAIFYAMSKSDQDYALHIGISGLFKSKYINKQEVGILTNLLLRKKGLNREYLTHIKSKKYSTEIANATILEITQAYLDYLNKKHKVSTRGSFGRAVGSFIGAAAGIGTGLLVGPPPLNPAAVVGLGILGAKVGGDIGDAAGDAASSGKDGDKDGDKNDDNEEDGGDEDNTTPVNGESGNNCVGYPFTPPNN